MVPSHGQTRLSSMVERRSEWCISRQRVWGVPIPVFYHLETDEALMTPECIEHVASVVAQHGTDAWFRLSVEELLPPALKSSAAKYRKGLVCWVMEASMALIVDFPGLAGYHGRVV
jgi:isoleucyl-tRNA synthetase